MRVFLDTNVWISAFATSGLCEELLFSCLEQHKVLTGELLRAEISEVLAKKLSPSPATHKQIKELLQGTTRIEDAGPEIGDNDARLTEAASADAFVTGDKALQELGQVEKMSIVSPRQFFERYLTKR